MPDDLLDSSLFSKLQENAGLLPFVEKRKGSFFSGRKQKMEKGKGGLESEWFHIPPWEVPNFRNCFGQYFDTKWAVAFGQIFKIWTKKFLNSILIQISYSGQ